jgi:glycosyltransferase involved in cell wall biosynthesis
MRHRGILRLLEAVELRLYADAAAVVAVTDAFRKNLISRGVPAAKVHVVTNGVNCDWPDGPDPSRARAALGLDSKFLVVYVGTHGMAHNLGTLLDAADILRQDAGVRFVTVGDGADLSRLRRLKEERGLRNVSLIGQVPHDTARLYLRASDVAVVLLRKAEVFKTVVPSKVFEAMAAQKAVILGVDGEARRIVEEAQAGLCVEPEDAGQLAEAIQRLKGDEGLRQRLGRNGLLAVRERFDRTVLAGRMLDVLTALGPSRT